MIRLKMIVRKSFVSKSFDFLAIAMVMNIQNSNIVGACGEPIFFFLIHANSIIINAGRHDTVPKIHPCPITNSPKDMKRGLLYYHEKTCSPSICIMIVFFDRIQSISPKNSY